MEAVEIDAITRCLCISRRREAREETKTFLNVQSHVLRYREFGLYGQGIYGSDATYIETMENECSTNLNCSIMT